MLDKSSRPEVFCEKGVFRNFAKFTGKHLCQSLFLIKLQAAPVISFHFTFPMCTIFLKYSNTFILCVTHVIYKKLSCWTSPKIFSAWSKMYYKSFLKVSYFRGKVLEFPGYNKKRRSVKFCIFLPFSDIGFSPKQMKCFLQLFHPSITISTQSMPFNSR